MKIYCSGIGGIGLSAYAALQNANGHTVLGSDRSDSDLVADLRLQGIDVILDQDGSHVPEDLDLFVYSEAIPEDAPERVKAKECGVRQLSYFAALGELSKDYFVIAVCGTHGKSSTTAMTAKVLVDAGLDPTVVVGTKLPDLAGRNWRKGDSKYFVLEACEYRRSFHHLHPDIALMLNVDGDHFDAFASVEEYQQAFVEFLQKLPEDGNVITHLSDPECNNVASRSGRSIIDADGQRLPELQVPGKHMQENAQLILALADVLKIDQSVALASLASYKGCWRRMEVKGHRSKDILVIDDYGHHPKEIVATIDAIKSAYSDRRLVVAFQPHMHDRTRKFYDDFVRAFSGADQVLIADIYEARKQMQDMERVDMEKFVADISKKSSVACRSGGSLEETEQLLREEVLQPHDVLLVMGAGDVTALAQAMVS